MESKNNIFKIIFVIVGVVFLFLFLNNVNSYYVNINKFFNESRTNDGYLGYSLKRNSTDFIVDGCGSGTILDVVTGFCWDKNLNHNNATLAWALANTYVEPVWNSTNKNYTYPSGRVISDYPAFQYCDNLSLGGNTDYRLPSRNELQTLINQIGSSGQTCTTLTSYGFTNCQNNFYWTNDEYNLTGTGGWYVDLTDGRSNNNLKSSNPIYVVCVR